MAEQAYVDQLEREFQAMEDERDELYDSHEDDLDSIFRENEKLFHSSSWSKPRDENPEEIRSDGWLSCPSCFSMLSYECEKHVKYQQWRSVQPVNTIVNYEYTMKFEAEGDADQQQADPAVEVYYPVYCAHCQLNVAVIDADDVYHFFDVIFERK